MPLKGLLEIPPEGDIKSMEGYTALYRLRVGIFLVVFEINHDEKVIDIQVMGNRGDTYK
ncbi:type II toxin-antitoxin system RelE/ParE family toxin [Bacillus mycoides]|uniref:Type II toxin-antitoxin system RelE/ParE family toxin n=1 Tax=Bacillus mycoides TaxID=1405 RepID=A0A4U3A4M5_BACMY|nr:type II toxin-antitoxin system RelE/ParE family toxin [Bacillus mycoides]